MQTTTDSQPLVDAVLKDLQELKALGANVTDKAFDYVRQNPQQVIHARQNGLKISEISDLMLCFAV